MKLTALLPAVAIALSASLAQARDPASLKVEADRATLRAARRQLEMDRRQLRRDEHAGRQGKARADAQKIATDHGRIGEETVFLRTDLSAAREAREAREAARPAPR